MESDSSSPAGSHGRLGSQERDVLGVLLAAEGRVVSRRELSRRVGLSDLSERRCDALLVPLRRALGSSSIRTVRGRGWMIEPAATGDARDLFESCQAA
jgi:DNA-binding response OmpR family regulator